MLDADANIKKLLGSARSHETIKSRLHRSNSSVRITLPISYSIAIPLDIRAVERRRQRRAAMRVDRAPQAGVAIVSEVTPDLLSRYGGVIDRASGKTRSLIDAVEAEWTRLRILVFDRWRPSGCSATARDSSIRFPIRRSTGTFRSKVRTNC